MGVSVVIESRHLPPVELGGGGDDAEGGAVGRAVLRLLRPRVRAQLSGATLVDLAPWGQPGGTTWPLLGVVLGVVVLAVLALAVRGLLAIVRR